MSPAGAIVLTSFVTYWGQRALRQAVRQDRAEREIRTLNGWLNTIAEQREGLVTGPKED